MEKNNRVKIGARILSKDQLNKLLPSNENIMNQIAYIRNVANTERNYSKSVTSKKKNWDREFDRHFNNIFSILGGRGSGKTSVLLTMKYNIQYLPGETDIILPLIVPEKMGKVSEVLGCILGLLGDIVAEYDKFNINVYEGKRERKDLFEDCRKKKSSILREKYYDLLKQHRYTHADYRHILVKEYVGFSDYVSNSSHVLDSDQKLVVKFEEFIEELLEFKRIDNELENKEEPLIFIFFDDVDLSTERCAEVLNVILRYLSHSNIIVFVAGNYLTFSEVLTINALKKDNLLNSEMKEVFYNEKINEQKNALDIRMELTQDLLKKAMPPTYRYNMPLLDEKAKAEFEYATENTGGNDREGKNTIVYLKLFELIIKDFIDINYSTEKYKKKPFGNNFLYYNNELLYVIYKIFDNTPRGVMNVYYFLHSIQEERIIGEKDKILRLKRFLDTIVRSSTLLSKYENDIYRIIDLKDSYKDTFIDYNYIETMVEEQDRKINSREINPIEYNIIPIDDVVTIFILAYFVENVIIFDTKGHNRKRKTHGTDVLWKILNSSNKNFSIYPKINDVQMLLKMYEKISATISQTNINNLSHHDKYFMGKYFEVLDSLQRDKLSILFQSIYFNDKDRKWIDEKIDVIMKYGGGFKIILKENMNYVYDIAKNMYFDKEMLKNIAKHIKYLNYIDDNNHDYENMYHDIYDINKIYFDNETKSFFSNEELKIYIKKGIITELDCVNEHYENLLNYFDDRLLDFEIRLKRVSKVVYLNREITLAYQEILDFSEKSKDRYDNGLGLNDIVSKYKFLFIDNYHNYIFEEEFNNFLRDFRYEIREIRVSRVYPRSYQDSITSFYEKLIKLESVLPNGQISELKIDIIELHQIFIDYVKAKTILDINRRKDSPDGKEGEGINKESFYIMFERLKKELFDTSKIKHTGTGFYEYIIEKENESKKVNI